MKRAPVIFVFACAACFGQGSNTILLNVFRTPSNPTGQISTYPQASTAIQNIGQGSHLIQVIETNATGQTCNTSDGNILVRLEASLDNTLWTPVGTPITLAIADVFGHITGSTIAFGAFPFLRVNVLSFSNISCVLTVEYSGTLYPSSLNPALSSVQSNYQTANAEINSTTGIGGGALNLLIGGDGPGSGPGGRIVIYGLFVTNEGATTTTVRLYETTSSSCSTGSILGVPFSAIGTGVLAGQTYSFPTSAVPFYTGKVANGTSNLCAQIGNSNYISVTVIYRIE